MTIAIILDTETTGLLLPITAPLVSQPKIIELGAIKVDMFEKIESLSQLINPEEKLSAKIIKITGIKDDDLVEAPTFKEFSPKLIEFFKGCDLLIAHNAAFDVGMLSNELKRSKNFYNFPWPAETICTVNEYAPLLGYMPKLINLYEHIIGKPLAQTHRAVDDCEALYEILIEDKFFEKIEGL